MLAVSVCSVCISSDENVDDRLHGFNQLISM